MIYSELVFAKNSFSQGTLSLLGDIRLGIIFPLPARKGASFGVRNPLNFQLFRKVIYQKYVP